MNIKQNVSDYILPIFCDLIQQNGDVAPDNIQLNDSITERRRDKTSQNVKSERLYPYITESTTHIINGHFVF
jgi:hypothetical protein